MKNNQGDELIFLISLPRSGSTLLQHILASHTMVTSSAEPWLLLHHIYVIKQDGLRATYNGNVAQVALKEFIDQIDNGQEVYHEGVRNMVLHLVRSYLEKGEKKIFLDKTSRNYLILPEIIELFPNARFIFLVRNPISTFASYLTSMVHGDLCGLSNEGIREDLLLGYKYIKDGMDKLQDKTIFIKYENLVQNPEKEIKALCDKLALPYESSMIEYGNVVGKLPGKLVDPKSIHLHTSPVADYLNDWQKNINDPQKLLLTKSFLDHLGEDLINSLGYSYRDLLNSLSTKKRFFYPLVSWKKLMKPTHEKRFFERIYIDSILKIQDRDFTGLIKYYFSLLKF